MYYHRMVAGPELLVFPSSVRRSPSALLSMMRQFSREHAHFSTNSPANIEPQRTQSINPPSQARLAPLTLNHSFHAGTGARRIDFFIYGWRLGYLRTSFHTAAPLLPALVDNNNKCRRTCHLPSLLHNHPPKCWICQLAKARTATEFPYAERPGTQHGSAKGWKAQKVGGQ